MNLRERKIKDYNSLLRDSIEPQIKKPPKKKHIPIYLQKVLTVENSNKSDPFKFIEERPKKNKKDENTDSDSSTFENSMHEILKDIINKENKAKTQRKKVIKLKLQPESKKCIKTNVNNINNKQTDVVRKNFVSSTHVNLKESLKSPQGSNKINIISDVVIRPAITPSPSHSFEDSYEDVINSSCTTLSIPWRGDNLNLKRNPHWLSLKDTSLPFYNQEMILQPELLEKSTVSKPIPKQDSLIQTSISDFTTHANESPVKINNTSVLFDEQRFSPIKTREKSPDKVSDNSSLFDENSFSPITKRYNLKTRNARRTILGSLNNDTLINNMKNVSHNYSYSFLGDEDKENGPRQFKNRKNSPSAMPMRVNISDLKKVREEVAEELLENIQFNESLPAADTDETHGVVGLFEDLEPPPVTPRTYTSKKRRNVRIASSDEEVGYTDRPKKKKKDNRTKAEKDAFRKWAREFNAMCEEVEMHNLETE